MAQIGWTRTKIEERTKVEDENHRGLGTKLKSI
jgi:hypothetical protein